MLTIILLILALILVSYIFFIKKNIRDILSQLSEKSSGENDSKIFVSLFDNDINTLVEQINNNINIQKEMKINILRREQNLKEAITSISHDLRTPLTSIIGYLQLLQASDLDERQKQNLHTAIQKSDILRKLINEFFELSTIDSNDSRPNFQRVNIVNFVTDSIMENVERFEKARIVPVMSIPDESIYILADETMLKRIMQNLITNAIQHSKGNLEISLIKSETIRLHFKNKIEDRQSINIEKLFDRFYTADKIRNSSSTGLGLSIVKALISKMNGKATAFHDNDILDICIEFPEIL